MLQCKYTYSQDTLISGKSCKSLLLSQTIYLMIKLMMEDVMVNIALSTNGSKLCSFFVKSVVGPHDIWKQRQNLITFWCRITKKIHGEYHIFNQSEQSCLEMLTNEAATFGTWSTEEFCATKGILRAFFRSIVKNLLTPYPLFLLFGTKNKDFLVCIWTPFWRNFLNKLTK